MTRKLRWLPKYLHDYLQFARANRSKDTGFPMGRMFPILGEHLAAAGVASGQYFHQDLYVAQRIFAQAPKRHVDIGSRVDGFVAHVATFRPIEVVDVRMLATDARNITFLQADLQDPAAISRIGLSDSVSCLHVLEHFGLGRYGDPIDVDGHLHGIANIAALVEPAGRLYLSVPIGPQRVEFNAHRVFAASTIPALLEKEFTLARFSFVDDTGRLHEGVPFSAEEAANNFGCHIGCGIYELTRAA